MRRRRVRTDEAPLKDLFFTKKQLLVVQSLAKGYSYKQVAADIGISDRTVEQHVTRLLKFNGVSNATRLVLLFERAGLLEDA